MIVHTTAENVAIWYFKPYEMGLGNRRLSPALLRQHSFIDLGRARLRQRRLNRSQCVALVQDIVYQEYRTISWICKRFRYPVQSASTCRTPVAGGVKISDFA